MIGWGSQVRKTGPTHGHSSHLFNWCPKPLLISWKRRWHIFRSLPSWPLGFEFTLFFPAVKTKIHWNIFFSLQPYIYKQASLFASLCCEPRLNISLGKTPTTNSLLPDTSTYTVPTKTLFSTGTFTELQEVSKAGFSSEEPCSFPTVSVYPRARSLPCSLAKASPGTEDRSAFARISSTDSSQEYRCMHAQVHILL